MSTHRAGSGEHAGATPFPAVHKLKSPQGPFSDFEPLTAIKPMPNMRKVIAPQSPIQDLDDLRASFPFIPIMPIPVAYHIVGPAAANAPFTFQFPDRAKLVRFATQTAATFVSFKENPTAGAAGPTFYDENNSAFGFLLHSNNLGSIYFIGDVRQCTFIMGTGSSTISIELWF